MSNKNELKKILSDIQSSEVKERMKKSLKNKMDAEPIVFIDRTEVKNIREGNTRSIERVTKKFIGEVSSLMAQFNGLRGDFESKAKAMLELDSKIQKHKEDMAVYLDRSFSDAYAHQRKIESDLDKRFNDKIISQSTEINKKSEERSNKIGSALKELEDFVNKIPKNIFEYGSSLGVTINENFVGMLASVNFVFGEDLTPQGAGIVFNLARTPLVGSVKLYRGGSYQQVGSLKDYIISGGKITLSSSLSAPTEVLTVDYMY